MNIDALIEKELGKMKPRNGLIPLGELLIPGVNIEPDEYEKAIADSPDTYRWQVGALAEAEVEHMLFIPRRKFWT